MNDIEKRETIPSTSSLSKLGVSAVGYTAGGIFLFVLQAFPALRWPGLVIGVIVCLAGIASFMSKDPADKKAGTVIAAAGALTVLSKIKIPLISAASGALLFIGAAGLLAIGIRNGIKFFLGLKKRA